RQDEGARGRRRRRRGRPHRRAHRARQPRRAAGPRVADGLGRPCAQDAHRRRQVQQADGQGGAGRAPAQVCRRAVPRHRGLRRRVGHGPQLARGARASREPRL
ncbi:hypothetical protein BN1708_019325, partial [Verticillium longisporum]